MRNLLFVMILLIAAPVLGQWDQWKFEGFPVYSKIPKDAVGLVILLHGSGGSADFAVRADTTRVMDALLDAGYGFFATSSTQRTRPKRWDPRNLDMTANPDLGRLERLYKKVIDDGDLSVDTPLFIMGMSNGANMATTVGYVFNKVGYPVRAVAPYQGGFAGPIIEAGDYDVPTFLVIAENDMIVNNDKLQAVYEGLREKDRPIELHVAEERPVDAAWLKSYGVKNPNKSLRVLTQKGLIDQSGNRRVGFTELLEKGRDGLIFRELGNDAGPVRNAVMAAWALHKMRSDYRLEQLQFFEKFRQP